MRKLSFFVFLYLLICTNTSLATSRYEHQWLRADVGFGGYGLSYQLSNNDPLPSNNTKLPSILTRFGDGWQIDLRIHQDPHSFLDTIEDRATGEEIDPTVTSFSLLRSFSRRSGRFFVASGLGPGIYTGEFVDNCQEEPAIFGSHHTCDVNNSTAIGIGYNAFAGIGHNAALGFFVNGAATTEGNFTQVGISLLIGQF